MKKKDARILWNENDKGEIFEFEIARVTAETGYETRFQRKYAKSFGNCNSIWEDYKAIDVIIYFFRDKFTTWELGTKFLDDLTQIDEFREDMKRWIEQMPDSFE